MFFASLMTSFAASEYFLELCALFSLRVALAAAFASLCFAAEALFAAFCSLCFAAFALEALASALLLLAAALFALAVALFAAFF